MPASRLLPASVLGKLPRALSTLPSQHGDGLVLGGCSSCFARLQFALLSALLLITQPGLQAASCWTSHASCSSALPRCVAVSLESLDVIIGSAVEHSGRLGGHGGVCSPCWGLPRLLTWCLTYVQERFLHVKTSLSGFSFYFVKSNMLYAIITSNLKVFLRSYLFLLEKWKYREEERQKDVPFTGLLPKWSQQPELS